MPPISSSPEHALLLLSLLPLLLLPLLLLLHLLLLLPLQVPPLSPCCCRRCCCCCCWTYHGLPLPLLSFVTVKFSTVTVQVLHSSAAPSLKFRSSTVAVPCCPVIVMFLQAALTYAI
jgi:hypothetical protein